MEYVFQNTKDDSERRRLQAIEAIFDPSSQRRIVTAGIKPGAVCLEVGAGAGSLMRWMAEQVGPSGRVTAVDINTRFLTNPPANVTVVEGDVRTLNLERESFDLIHARYVLVHIPEYEKVLDSLWKALKIGGALVIEEPDFTAYRGLSGVEVESFDKVHQAILRMYKDKGVDPALGSKLPNLFQSVGAKNLSIENDSPPSPGGGALARMMGQSADLLKDKYLATGCVDLYDLAAYERFTQNPDSSAIYYVTISVVGRK
jgi:predicted O-methyltransferase YrrM